MTVRAMPKSDQRSCGELWAGSRTSSAPKASASRRRVGEKSAASTGPCPRPLSAAMTASPTGPQPTTRQGWPGLSAASPTACSPTASGSVSAARSVSRRVGHGEQQQLLQHHVLGQRAGVRVGVADLLHAGGAQDDGHRADACPDRQRAGRVGPVLHDLRTELVAEDAVGVRVEGRHAHRVHEVREMAEVGQRVQIGAADAGGERAHHDVARGRDRFGRRRRRPTVRLSSPPHAWPVHPPRPARPPAFVATFAR